MVAWVESDEMTLVTVLEVPVVPVVVPLVDIAHVSDGVGMQTGKGLLHLFVFLSKNLTGSDGVDKEFAYDGHVCCAAIAGHTVIALIGLVFILG